MKAELMSNHAAALGRHGSTKRWSKTSADERAKTMRIVRRAKEQRNRASNRWLFKET